MKNIFLFLAFNLINIVAKACPNCQKQIPVPFRNIVHNGALPESNWDYVIVSLTMAITLFCVYYTFRHLFSPGEKGSNHIKYSIIHNS